MKKILEDIIEQEQIFQIKPLNSDNDRFVIICGQFKVSNNEFETKDEAMKYLETKPWEIILNTAALIAKGVFLEGYEKFINNNQKSEENGNN